MRMMGEKRASGKVGVGNEDPARLSLPRGSGVIRQNPELLWNSRSK